MDVKICGLSSDETVQAALDAGADCIGFVFFEKSPRNVSELLASRLATKVRGKAKIIALCVNATDETLLSIANSVRPDVFQLHGSESPQRVINVRQLVDRPIMKALSIRDSEDLDQIADYEPVVDYFLFDAKPPKNSVLPGGNGVPFDWKLIENLDLDRPFMLSGGLNPVNVSEAVRLTRPDGVDVSSGVESSPGVKDQDQIALFIEQARQAAG
ncbi:MAG: phosphoribosylanthranilate isomerase [Cohaesibacteraceae bacterium]|nr:phosphoribosylanthranilate isomerase [Cohaesibacteraceae bacterium]